MDVELVAYGVAGFIVSVAVYYYYRLIVRNLEENEDVSLAMFFLNDAAPRAFMVLIGSIMLYAIAGPAALLTGYIEMLPEIDYRRLIRVGTILAFLGTVYWERVIYRVTTPPSERR